MEFSQWELLTLRTRIHVRLLQLGIRHQRRVRIVELVSRVTNIPRLAAFIRHLDGKQKATLKP